MCYMQLVAVWERDYEIALFGRHRSRASSVKQRGSSSLQVSMESGTRNALFTLPTFFVRPIAVHSRRYVRTPRVHLA